MSIAQSDIDALLLAAEQSAPTAEPAAPPVSFVPEAPRAPRTVRSAPAASRSHPPPPDQLRRILRMRVPVIVKLAECDMPVSTVLKFTSGSILEFEKPADAELELLANNKIIGYGQAVKVGEKFGLRVTRLYGPEKTISALGGVGH